jgi:hypothetical protein
VDFFHSESEVIRYCSSHQGRKAGVKTSDTSRGGQSQPTDLLSPPPKTVFSAPGRCFDLTPHSKELISSMLDENSPFLPPVRGINEH